MPNVLFFLLFKRLASKLRAFLANLHLWLFFRDDGQHVSFINGSDNNIEFWSINSLIGLGWWIIYFNELLLQLLDVSILISFLSKWIVRSRYYFHYYFVLLLSKYWSLYYRYYYFCFYLDSINKRERVKVTGHGFHTHTYKRKTFNN